MFLRRQKMVYLTIKKRLKYLVVGPGARKTFQLSGRTLRIPFNVLSRTTV